MRLWGWLAVFYALNRLKSKITLPSLCQETVTRDHYIFMWVCVFVCVCVNCWLNCYMSKRACHTITNYLNENHRQVRQVITECARTYINEPAMQNWICKRHIYFPSRLLLPSPSPYPSSISFFALYPTSPSCQLNDCCSFLSVSLSQHVN